MRSVQLPMRRAVGQLIAGFHDSPASVSLFQSGSAVEIVSLRGFGDRTLRKTEPNRRLAHDSAGHPARVKSGFGAIAGCAVWSRDDLSPGATMRGPPS